MGLAKSFSEVACSSQQLSFIGVAMWFLPVITCKIYAAEGIWVFIFNFKASFATFS